MSIIYVYLNVRVYRYYAHISVHMCTCVCVCVHMCVCVRIYVCLFMCTFVCVCLCAHLCVCVNMYVSPPHTCCQIDGSDQRRPADGISRTRIHRPPSMFGPRTPTGDSSFAHSGVPVGSGVHTPRSAPSSPLRTRVEV